MNCPDETELLGFLAKEVPPDRLSEIEGHFDGCAGCRELAFVLATQSGGGEPARGDALVAGSHVGRFAVDELIAEGAMGMVFRAHDTTLRRDVALKLLHVGSRVRPDAHARMLREAQGLARLDHPNIVTVFETGLYAGEVFIAMELVDGVSFDRWLAGDARGWRQIAGMLEQAARGLAAAHASGLVHRDVKPANVMVAADDRVKVVDFGLARAVAEVVPGSGTFDAATFDVTTRLTATGTLVGTPAYCAPEQLAGYEVDTASDVFAFCVMFCEAALGARPFAGTTASELLARMGDGTGPVLPRAGRVPGRVLALVRRGLAFDPRQRPTMDELAAALAVRPRRWPFVAAGAAALAIAVPVVAIAASPREPEPCTDAAAELAPVWNAERRAQVRAAILDTKLSFAPGTWDHVDRAIEDYGARWRGTHGEACRATAVHGTQSPAMLDRRMACLATRRASFDATITALTELDRGSLREAHRLVGALPSLAECNDPTSLLAVTPPPTDAVAVAELAQIRQLIARASALRAAGKFEPSLAATQVALPLAERVGYKPVLAEVLFVRGEAEALLERRKDARASYEAALLAAAASGYAALEARLHAELALLLRDESPDGRVALGHARHAIALLDRAGGDPALEARARYAAARALFSVDHAAALRELELGRKRVDELSASSPEAALQTRIEYELVEVHNSSDVEGVLVRLKALLAEAEVAFGPEHPNLARIVWEMAEFAVLVERFDEANAYARRVAQLLAPYPGHDVLLRRFNAGLEPDPAKRLPLLETVVRDAERHYGATSPQLAISLQELADTMNEVGRSREALPIVDRAIAIWDAAYGGRYQLLIFGLVTKTEIAYALHDIGAATAAAERTMALAERDSYMPVVAVMSKLVLAELYFRLGRYAEVLALIEAIRPNLNVLPAIEEKEHLELEFVEAACSWKLGRDATGLARARAIHRRYRSIRGADPPTIRDQAEWLAKHGR